MIETEFKYGQKVRNINHDTIWTFVGIDPREENRAVVVQNGYPPYTYLLDHLEPVRESKGFIVLGNKPKNSFYECYILSPQPKEKAQSHVDYASKIGWNNLQIVEIFE